MTDKEMESRSELLRKLRIADEAKSGRNGWFVAGGVVGVCGLLPFLIGSFLNSIGAIKMGSGVGFGLLLFLCGLCSAVLFVIGAVSERIG